MALFCGVRGRFLTTPHLRSPAGVWWLLIKQVAFGSVFTVWPGMGAGPETARCLPDIIRSQAAQMGQLNPGHLEAECVCAGGLGTNREGRPSFRELTDRQTVPRSVIHVQGSASWSVCRTGVMKPNGDEGCCWPHQVNQKHFASSL